MASERQTTSALARSLLDLCRSRKLTIATAESCTGGLVAGALTDIPGSSDVIDRGFVTYSNDAKRAMLGVKVTTLATFGAVSKETATAMAVGALVRAFVSCHKSGRKLALVGLNHRVHNVLHLTGIAPLFDTYATVSEAEAGLA